MIILHFTDSEWKVQQRLVRMMFVVKSMTGEETARELISVLSVSQHSTKPSSCCNEGWGKRQQWCNAYS